MMQTRLTVFSYLLSSLLFISSVFASSELIQTKETPLKNGFFSVFSKSALKIETSNSNEIWNRARNRFHLSKPVSSTRYRHHIKNLAHQQSYINELIAKASPYLFFVLEEVEKRGMPSEIAFLPMIESTFDPHDRSHKGAVGLWQIMPTLGREHGLKQNSWYDGRKDIYESTKVALDHLEYLHRRFDGNWYLALAAYNSGEARVLKAIKKNRAAKKPTDFWSLKLPKETLDYVPKLLAWVEIIRSPKQYGLVLPHVPNQPVFTRVNAGKPIDISHAAKLADISELQLRKLNPGLHKKSMDPKGPFHLVVPIRQANVIKEKLHAKPAPTENTKKAEVSVAKEVKLAALEADKVAKTEKDIKKKEKADNNTNKSASSDVVVKSSTKKAKKTSGTKMHTVKKGESIPKICKKYRIPMKTFLKKNHLRSQSSIIQPGQKLIVST